MSGRRYLIFVPTDAAARSAWRDRIDCTLTSLPSLKLSLDLPEVLVMSESPGIAIGECGIVIGPIVRNGMSLPATTLSLSDIESISATRGTHLVDHFWGGYIAILTGRTGVDLIRAPMGDLACYHVAVAGGTFIASDIDLLTQFAGYRVSINWSALADMLIAPELRRHDTCLEHIRELGVGERLALGDRATTQLWTPWAFVPDRPSVSDDEERIATVRKTVGLAVAARAACYDRSVLLLSGGLDSSIVAASLIRWHCSAAGVTMVTRDRSGDERGYASRVASHLSLPLHAVLRETANVDITRSSAAGLPYPSERSFSQATMTAAQALAHSTGATAILHGGGGDNVFNSLQSAAPVTDLIRHGNIGPRLWATVRSIATITQATHAAVIRQAVARLVRRGPAYRWRPVLDLLPPEIRERADAAIRHPWLASPAGAMPGSAAHIANVLRAVSIIQSPDARAPLPLTAVLLAQPIVEACLAIPSWCWFDRGHNRAVARHAFSEMLPHDIAWRTSKGTPDSFMVELYETNRERIRAFLLQGELAATGLIDRDAVERELARDGPTKGLTYARVMQFVDVEAWLRSWRA